MAFKFTNTKKIPKQSSKFLFDQKLKQKTIKKLLRRKVALKFYMIVISNLLSNNALMKLAS